MVEGVWDEWRCVDILYMQIVVDGVWERRGTHKIVVEGGLASESGRILKFLEKNDMNFGFFSVFFRFFSVFFQFFILA